MYCVDNIFCNVVFSCNREEIEINVNNEEDPIDTLTSHILHRAVTDVDGNSYDAVLIGDQVWMAENLRTTRFPDGMDIPLGTTGSISPCRFVPGNGQSNEENSGNEARFGYLYNWPAVMYGDSSSSANPSGVQGICPSGWHVPSSAEWSQLINYVSGQIQYQCDSNSINIAKSLSSSTEWESSPNHCAVGNNLTSNNATGFRLFPLVALLLVRQ